MKTSSSNQNIEFVAIMALLMSLVALSIDAILPALSQISASFGSNDPESSQLLLSLIFLGMSIGLMIYGPLSDAYGRKAIIFIGVGIFLLGSVVSLLSNDYNLMLAGRFIQGFGVAACRVVSLAMIRDKFEGQEMAKIMSLITTIFVIVPAIAPSIGQVIVLYSNWEAIFIFVMMVGLASITWLHFRQKETLMNAKKRPFALNSIIQAFFETIRTPSAMGYTIASGLIFGGFIGYLGISQPLLQVEYELGKSFTTYFGILSLSVGFASYMNSQLLNKYSMEQLSKVALVGLIFISLIFICYTTTLDRKPDFWIVFFLLLTIFYCFGFLFGNLNTLAIKPLGHIAGTASSVIASIQMLISTSFGMLVGYFYQDNINSLVFGFLISGVVSLVILLVSSSRTINKYQSLSKNL